MKPITKLYIKAFLFTGIPFGILMTILDFKDGKGFVLWEFLFLTAFFGFFMSLTLVSWHIKELRKIGINKFTDEILSSDQKTEFEINISKEELIQKLRNDPMTKNMNLEESGDLIVLKTKPSWRSWGEKILITLDELENGVKQVLISSKPKLSTTFLDFGKNKENILLIEKLLTKTL